MSDRELLELAAKAAGFTVGEGSWCNPSYFDGGAFVAEVGKWNPLTDDGAALRLAVKLRLLVLPSQSGEIVTVDSFTAIDEATENAKHDPNAATRRAIVRAAAAIQQSKQPLPADEALS
jgi:hypothetical protein